MDAATLAKVKAKIEELKAKRASMPQKSPKQRAKKSYGSTYSAKDNADLKAFKESMKEKGWDPEQMDLETFMTKQQEKGQ